MSDADALEAIEALCESAIGQDDEASVALHEILRVCRKRKAEKNQKHAPLWGMVTDPRPGDLDG